CRQRRFGLGLRLGSGPRAADRRSGRRALLQGLLACLISDQGFVSLKNFLAPPRLTARWFTPLDAVTAPLTPDHSAVAPRSGVASSVNPAGNIGHDSKASGPATRAARRGGANERSPISSRSKLRSELMALT